MQRYYTNQVRKAVATLCGSFGQDDDIDDSTAYRRRLMLGEEAEIPQEDHGVSGGAYVSPMVVTLANTPVVVTPARKEADACISASQACISASQQQRALPVAKAAAVPSTTAAATAATVPAPSETAAPPPAFPSVPKPAAVPAVPVGASEVTTADVDVSASEDTPPPPPSLDDIMARVQQLEDEGKLVEASALMLESMRLQAQSNPN